MIKIKGKNRAENVESEGRRKTESFTLSSGTDRFNPWETTTNHREDNEWWWVISDD